MPCVDETDLADPAFRARPADVAGRLFRSVQTAIADLAPCAEVELHNFTSELILRAEIADLFNRQIPESVLAAYRLYRDTLCEVDQQIRAATSCDAIFIRGSSTAVQGQMTVPQSKRRALFRKRCANSSMRRWWIPIEPMIRSRSCSRPGLSKTISR